MTREEFINWFEGFTILTKNDIYELGQLYDEVTKPRWISVEDELPPKGQWVLCFTKSDSEINTLRYDIYNWKGICFTVSLDDVTHWMPLPQAPKEGGEK